MPQDGDGQEPRTDSPTVQPEQTPVETQPTQSVDTDAATDQTNASETSHPSEGSPAADRPRDDAGRFAPKDSKPSASNPVKDAIDRLAKSSTTPAPKPAGKPAADQPKSATAPEVKPTDEALTTRTKDDFDFTPEERAKLRKDTAERFDRVLGAARTAREELEKAAPLIERGKSYASVLDRFDLHADIGFVPEDHFAGVVKAQAAINRALIAIHQGRLPAPGDVETFKALAENVDMLRSKIGLPATPAAPSAPVVKPFEGELPADLKDLVEVYGLSEQRARLIAAAEAREKTPAPAPVAPEQPVQAPAKPVGVDMEQLYGRKLVAELQTSGVQNPAEHMRVLLRHPQTRQEVINRFPGITVADVPAVFDSLDAPTKYEILKAAHMALTVSKVPARRPTPPPPATPKRGVPPTAPPRRAATSAGSDAVSEAIAHLARE